MKTPPVCDYEGSDYQERFWEKGNRAYEDAAEVIALKRMLPSGSGHLLELGAGAGRNTPRYTGFEQITLLDYSTSQLKQANERLGDSKKYRFVAADVYRLPFAPGVFSAATMIRTIHHLSDPLAAFEQLNTSMVDQGTFILEFANKRNIKSIFRYWMKKQDWDPFTLDPVEFVELNYNFHPKRVYEWMHEAGFEIQKKIAVSYLRAGLIKRVFPLFILRGFEHIIQRAFSWATLSPSIFLKSKVINDVEPSVGNAFFRCPSCSAYPLEDTPPLLVCKDCGKKYTVKDNIYDFRLEK